MSVHKPKNFILLVIPSPALPPFFRVTRKPCASGSNLLQAPLVMQKERVVPQKSPPNNKNTVRYVFEDKISPGLQHVCRMLNFFPDYARRDKQILHMRLSGHFRKTKWVKVAYKQPVKPLHSLKNVENRLNFRQSWRDSQLGEFSQN